MKKVAIVAVFVIIMCGGCSEDTEYPEASLINKDFLMNDWSYYGFSIFYNRYTPNDSIVGLIKDAFKPASQKILIFTSPSCYSCGKADSLVPFFMKILESSAIGEQYLEIYNVPSVNSGHPYKALITLKVLPSAYIMSDSTVRFSVLDLFNQSWQNDNNWILEQSVLESLQ